MISDITNAILPEVEEWQNRPLKTCYPFVFVDCMYVSVRNDYEAKEEAVYVILGYDLQGQKEILGLWMDPTESKNYWMQVFDEIKAQLAYREENQGKVAAFHTTRTLGTDTKVLFDEDAGKFMVTRARNLVEANPDVLDFADVTGCNLDVDERRSELKREDKDGKEISYNPPRYEYSYDFYITIFVNNPYFDEMRFKINSDSVDVTPPPAMRPGMATRYDPESNVEYRNCKKLGEEIRQMLTQVRKDVREKIEQAAAPKAAITCPYCCATTTPDASGRCEYCGGALNG